MYNQLKDAHAKIVKQCSDQTNKYAETAAENEILIEKLEEATVDLAKEQKLTSE